MNILIVGDRFIGERHLVAKGSYATKRIMGLCG